MVRSKEISTEKRAQMEVLDEQRLSHRKIAAILNISHSAVTKGLQRMKELGSYK